jgi:hypothetical protein
LVVFGHAVAAATLSWAYFRRYPVSRPPIGVINLTDVALILGGIVLIPYLYLALPAWLVAGLLMLGIGSVLYAVCEPVLPGRRTVWLVVIVLTMADIAALLRLGAESRPFIALNNALLVLAVVGVANLWAQSGLRARDTAVLAGALTIYDVIFTTQLPLMADLFHRLADLPFAPFVSWPLGDGDVRLSVGLGDLILMAVSPLALHKAFGRRAGLITLATTVGAIGVMLALLDLGLLPDLVPAMVALGPLVVAQYLYWSHRRGAERTTWQYLQAEPIHRRIASAR